MLLKIAWRNVWRSKVRSFVVIIAIALGLWAGVFASGFMVGMMDEKVNSVIELEMSHFQLHHSKFRDEISSVYLMTEGEKILEELRNEKSVKEAAGRIISMSMISSANLSGAIKVLGIDPEIESKAIGLDKNIIEGNYFERMKRNPILLSSRVAEKYKVKIGSKVVLTFQDMKNEITSAAFRVVGIFDTHNGLYDNMNVFVRSSDLKKLMGVDKGYHEIAVLLKEHDQAEPMTAKYQDKYPDLEVLSWMDLSTGMRLMVEMMDLYTVILVGIILLALLFSIINTMLMAVLERSRELGMLMAVGMSKGKVFSMIMMETIFLSAVGGPLGLFIAWSSIAYFGKTGIDLGSDGEIYSDLGFAPIIYPALGIESYIYITIMVLVMAVLAAIYPARKALKLSPVEAIQKI